jgi:enoyl-CoA hydratase/carnithine racemase
MSVSRAMTRDFIAVDREDRIGWLILNRPAKLNAMNPQMLDEFSGALAELTDDPAVRVIITRGAGRAFSAGFDIDRPPSVQDGDLDVTENYARLVGNIDRFLEIWDCPKPVIAAVHGHCLAGATQMAVFCDLTVVAENARIGWPTMPVGGGYISPIWTWLVGPKRAKQMSFNAGSSVSGREAADWGWANFAVAETELWDEVRNMALRIVRIPADVLQMKKYAVNRVLDLQGFRSSVKLGAETDALLHASRSVGVIRQAIREYGLTQAIEEFNRGAIS